MFFFHLTALAFFDEWKDRLHPHHKCVITARKCAQLFGLPVTSFRRAVKSTAGCDDEDLVLPTRGVHLRSRRVFTDDEELLLAEFVRQAFWSGFGLSKDEFLALSAKMATSIGRNNFKASAGFYRSFTRRFPDLKPRKTSSLDLKRAKKATVETRDALFKTIDDMITRLYMEQKIPYATFEEWPAKLKYSYDEGEL